MVPPSKWRILAGALLAVLVLSCASSRHRNPEGSLRVFNDGTAAMSQLYVTPSTSSTWGAEQLGPYALQPADSLTLTRLYPSFYDVRARFTDGSSDTVYDVLVQDDTLTTLSLRNSGNGAVAVFNNTGLAITGIYLTPSGSSTWGPNQTDLPLSPGQSLTLTGISPDTYDLRVVFSTAATTDYMRFTVAAGTTYTLQVN